MKLDEYVNDRSREGGDVKTDIEQIKALLAQLRAEVNDQGDTIDTLMTEVIPND